MIRNYILCDLDHTVSDAFHRDHMIGSVSWDDYHAGFIQDKPIEDITLMLANLVQAGYKIIGITARPEKWRAATVQWCVHYAIDLHDLLMRPDGNYDQSNDLKIYLAQRYFQGDVAEHVAFILDDRQDVIEAFNGIGVTAMQVYARRKA